MKGNEEGEARTKKMKMKRQKGRKRVRDGEI
jgi:hypothetical protein